MGTLDDSKEAGAKGKKVLATGGFCLVGSCLQSGCDNWRLGDGIGGHGSVIAEYNPVSGAVVG